MKVRSTGLGSKELACEVLSFNIGDKGGIIATIHSLRPVRWIIRGLVEPEDIAVVVKALLSHPGTLIRIFWLLTFGRSTKYPETWLSEKELHETLHAK